MFKILAVIFFVFYCNDVCLAWNSRACFVNHIGYVQKILQQTMYEVENNVKFCNLRINDFNRTVNDQMYSFRVSGLVQYKNSFLISIDSMDVDAISATVTRRVNSATNISEYEALVRASLHFRAPRIGFEVIADLDGIGIQHHTSMFEYDSVTFQFWILKNINANETTVSTSHAGQSSRFQRMQFFPNTNVTQVLSRDVQGFDMDNSLTTWGREIIVPIMQRLADTEIPFPEIRFDGC